MESVTLKLLKRVHILLLQLVLAFLSVFVCSTTSAQNHIVFKDNFKNNKHQWKMVNNKEFTVRIKYGWLQFEKTNRSRIHNGCLWYSKAIPKFDTQKPFRISFDAVIISANDVINGFDIQWGVIPGHEKMGTEAAALYQLNFSSNWVRLGQFSKNNGWKYSSISAPFTNHDGSGFYIRTGQSYHYEIIQSGNTLTLKINNTTVYTLPITPLAGGNSIGMQQCLRSKWYISNITIRQ